MDRIKVIQNEVRRVQTELEKFLGRKKLMKVGEQVQVTILIARVPLAKVEIPEKTLVRKRYRSDDPLTKADFDELLHVPWRKERDRKLVVRLAEKKNEPVTFEEMAVILKLPPGRSLEAVDDTAVNNYLLKCGVRKFRLGFARTYGAGYKFYIMKEAT